MGKQKTVFIHIGTHKTGSTAIQRSLQKNARLLRKHGYYFVLDSKRFLVALKSISNGDIDNLEKERKNFRKVIENTKCHSLILSSEGFSGSMLEAYSNISQIAKKLHYIIGDHNVKIIVYLRRQDQFIESAYIQTIHESKTWSFKEFCSGIGVHGFDWYEHLTHYAKFFGKENIIVRPYEKNQLKDGTVVSDFLSLIGIPFESIKPEATEWSNRSYSRSALEIARLCNGNLSIDHRGQLRVLLQATNTKQTFKEFVFFSSKERWELLSYYEKSNSEVAKEYLGREDSRLFLEPMPEDDSLRPEQSDGLSVDELAVLVMNIFLQSNIIRVHNTYTMAFIGEFERCILKVVDKVGMNNFLSRLYKRGINLIRRI